ncbi:unnamed protein product [Calypogeia fissa]
MVVEDQFERALESLKGGSCVAVLDAESREAESDLFFPAESLSPQNLRLLRTAAGGELYISIGHEVATAFGLPFIGEVLADTQLGESYPVLQHMSKERLKMCQGSCSVGLSLDHRSLKTGAPDVERSYTCRRLAELYKEVVDGSVAADEAGRLFGKEFHTPGHIFMCVDNQKGLQVRTGHTELSVALARAAGISPIMVGCVMLSNEGDKYGALESDLARSWTAANGVPFLTGQEVIDKLKVETTNNSHS